MNGEDTNQQPSGNYPGYGETSGEPPKPDYSYDVTQPEPEKEVPKIGPAEIHTMPEKFLAAEKGSGSKKVIIILIIILIVAILAAGAIYAYKTILNKNTNNANGNVSVVVTNDNKNANVNANQNVNKANSNVNGNQNVNYNINGLFNENLNTNASVNLNGNINTNLNVNMPTSKDSDNDGLTDLEENLFKTNVNKTDTDNDGYLDAQEIKSGYNPNGQGRIESTGLVKTYTSNDFGYSILYPASWVASNDPQNTNGVMFSTDTGEFVEATYYQNPSFKNAKDWYLLQVTGVDPNSVRTISNWDNSLTGIISPDGLSVYYAYQNKAFVVNYNPTVLTEANFKTTFEMMYKSFKIISTATNTNLNSNANTNTNTNLNSNINANTNANSNLNSNTNSNVNTNSNTNTG